MTGQATTVGRTVLVTLSESMAREINRRRTTIHDIADRIKDDRWSIGAQAHIGNSAAEGDVLPMIVVRVCPADRVNGQVLLDGNDTFWATSLDYTDEPAAGKWHWPVRS